MRDSDNTDESTQHKLADHGGSGQTSLTGALDDRDTFERAADEARESGRRDYEAARDDWRGAADEEAEE